jgi:hypothetical protein
VKGQKQLFPAPPRNPADLTELWTWLNGPLVVQRRAGAFGDGLTAVRTMLPVFAR